MERITKAFLFIAFLVLAAVRTGAQDTASYMPPSAPAPAGTAPGMTYKLLSDASGVQEYVLVFAKGDEVLSGISSFAAQKHIVAARFTAIGALREATIAWFDPVRKSYKLVPIRQQVELASLIGDIALYHDNPVVHTHCSLGLPDGSAKAGHLIQAWTYPTVELFMTVFSTPLQKEWDSETGLKLIHPEEK